MLRIVDDNVTGGHKVGVDENVEMAGRGVDGAGRLDGQRGGRHRHDKASGHGRTVGGRDKTNGGG